MLNTLLLNKVVQGFLFGETSLLRFWFAIMNFAIAGNLIYQSYPQFQFITIFTFLNPESLTLLFILCGSSIIYRLYTEKYNYIVFFIESFLPLVIWGGLLVTENQLTSNFTLLYIGTGISLYLLIRYPLMSGKERNCYE